MVKAGERAAKAVVKVAAMAVVVAMAVDHARTAKAATETRACGTSCSRSRRLTVLISIPRTMWSIPSLLFLNEKGGPKFYGNGELQS